MGHPLETMSHILEGLLLYAIAQGYLVVIPVFAHHVGDESDLLWRKPETRLPGDAGNLILQLTHHRLSCG